MSRVGWNFPDPIDWWFLIAVSVWTIYCFSK